MNKQQNTVYRTDDYTLFNTLQGNRDVLIGRVNKIIKSIKTSGYIFNPIIVNENMEVIDGQGRLEALKNLGMPVDYIIVEGLGIKECVALNIYQTHWNTMDYINSFADMGNVNYSYIRHLCKRFNNISIRVIVSAISEKSIGFEISNKTVQSGKMTCSVEQYEKAISILEYLEQFMGYIDVDKGRTELIYTALIFAYKSDSVDNDRMLERFIKYYRSDIVKPFNTIEGALQALNTVYNYRSSSDRLHLEVEYETMQRIQYRGRTNANDRKPARTQR